MPAPLYQAKAEFFRMLGHPVRIRVLELLQDGPKPVRDLLAEIDIKLFSLSRRGRRADPRRAPDPHLDARRAEPAAGRAPGIAYRADLTLSQ
jgi:DNA-binding transcriptional ArsR family regulator